MPDQGTLIIIKPDALKRGLMGAAISRLEPLRLEIIGAKVVVVNQALAEEHYQHIKDKPFFRETVDHLRGKLHGSASVVAFVLWGPDAIERVRQVTGATNPERAEPMTIRGALGRNLSSGLMENVIHASSDPAEAEREIRLWFKPHELLRDPFAPGPGARSTASASR
jgi:nucleoside-diphosphate kinase